MLDLIRMAFAIEPEKVLGGPSWLEMDRFDVFARTPPDSTPQSRLLMLRALLADRFKLVVHNDTRPMQAYALTAGNQVHMQEGSGATGCSSTIQKSPGAPPLGDAPSSTSMRGIPVIVYTCRNITMAAFAAELPFMPGAAQYLNGKPVSDRTELKGSWNLTFKFTQKIPTGIPVTGENMPLSRALEQQLGLKLEVATLPTAVIVVDSVNRRPADNSPDVTQGFPLQPTVFDVAEIKPRALAPTGGTRAASGPEIKNGRVYLPNLTLKDLINIAWDFNDDQMLVGAPKWLDDDRFDVIAKVSEGVAIGNLAPQLSADAVNIDALLPMLRALLTDSFRLSIHTEDRPINTYTLVVSRLKLKKADPTSRTKWQEGSVSDSNTTRRAEPWFGRMVTCQNVTMAQFAEFLPSIAPDYLHTDVVDATGLAGAWDFTFSFSPARMLQAGAPRVGGDGVPAGNGIAAAEDSIGVLSLFEALSKQLGLSLRIERRRRSVFVIDHVERLPGDK
jgi:uncharacterized protein (TIGR03435 family)